jgi:hypothetical protein
MVPHPADNDSWMICGVKTLSIRVRDKTSSDEPRESQYAGGRVIFRLKE